MTRIDVVSEKERELVLWRAFEIPRLDYYERQAVPIFLKVFVVVHGIIKTRYFD
jgi:hypothetical protein